MTITYAQTRDGITGGILTSAHMPVMDVIREGMSYRPKWAVHPSLRAETDDGESYYYEYHERRWHRHSDCGKQDEIGAVPPPPYILDGDGFTLAPHDPARWDTCGAYAGQ